MEKSKYLSPMFLLSDYDDGDVTIEEPWSQNDEPVVIDRDNSKKFDVTGE